MKAKILFLLIASTISVAAFSQKGSAGIRKFDVISADRIMVSKDSITTTFTGNVDVKGNNFHFSKADKIVYNKKDNILLIYNCKAVKADSISVLKGADGKEYIRYQL